MQKDLLIFLKSLLPAFFLFGCVPQPMNGSMGRWDSMMGYGAYGGMSMWLILIIVVGIIVYFVYGRGKKSETPRESANEIAMDILKKRYAKGEITKEEFDKIKRDIEG